MDREKLQKMASAVRTGGKGSVRSLLNEICAGLAVSMFYPCSYSDYDFNGFLVCVRMSDAWFYRVLLTVGKKKAVHKTTTTDDKRLQSTLKRIGVNAIPAIEEVNIFKDDIVIQFLNPKVQASVAANTWVVSGSPQTKKLQDILPQVLGHLGPDNLENLKKLAEQIQKQVPGAGSAAAAQDDDDVPDLVPGETFEAAAEEGKAAAS
ncbi:hypothetical protein SADUNF_Sadunf12G0025000 [Salix dunnii]|uniref:Nascent polypeptide-associated complex subunit beta n=1 Tax=Salix dunnii TaxID=1413687 RepID=A0A835JHA8_9ROSI|nr:hypothetical protein SADUNF_Sadunf12G0025000 [Salix dunnii]